MNYLAYETPDMLRYGVERLNRKLDRHAEHMRKAEAHAEAGDYHLEAAEHKAVADDLMGDIKMLRNHVQAKLDRKESA